MTRERLRGLIVSVQPMAGSALDEPRIVAAMAACALANGAVAVRIEGAQRIAAVRERLPGAAIVGLIKHEVPGFEPYITASLADVNAVLDAGADAVAADATARPRCDASTFADAVAAIHRRGRLAFADCAGFDDARAALAAGADILATTLCAYTKETRGTPLPALGLVRAIASLGSFAVCEGGIASPEQAAAAYAAGADAIVVGTAITNVDLAVRRFAGVVPRTS
jgi:N-acylglucosamine-6-phosphate 2-epimerase